MAQIIRRPGRVPAELCCLAVVGGGKAARLPSPLAAARGAAQRFSVGLVHRQCWNGVLGGHGGGRGGTAGGLQVMGAVGSAHGATRPPPLFCWGLAELHSAAQHSMAWRGVAQRSREQYGMAQRGTGRHRAARRGVESHRTAQHCTAHSTQLSTAWHRITEL